MSDQIATPPAGTPPPAASSAPPPDSTVNQPPTGGAGTGQSDWRATIPEEFRAHPALQDYKDIGSLVKSHVSMQSMLGKDKVVIPGEKATAEEWSAYYSRTGRPETPEKYDLPQVKLPNGFEMPVERRAALSKAIHDAGISQKSARALWEKVAELEGNDVKTHMEAVVKSREEGLNNLRKEWGSAYDERLNAAKRAVNQFGNEGLKDWLNKTGLGDDPNFIKYFSEIGKALTEDKAVGGGGHEFMKTPAQAVEEINSLKLDKEFYNALTTREHPGHSAAKGKWDQLWKLASSGEEKFVSAT